MQSPQSNLLPDGRLHLHHGPIDLIIQAWGPDCEAAFRQAQTRFETVLEELVTELPTLRQPAPILKPAGDIARVMAQATAPHAAQFVTPMAAVAGAVADTVCTAMCRGLNIDKAYVNNGGDIAVHLTGNHSLTAAIHDGADAGRVHFSADQPARGLATSGWRGRSHSRGIADAVTVVADTAAMADVAATLIANAVDLPDHRAITRHPATTLAPDSDLGDRLVTTAVGSLTRVETDAALSAGQQTAQHMLDAGLITAAVLFLKNRNTSVGPALNPDLTGDHNARLQTA